MRTPAISSLDPLQGFVVPFLASFCFFFFYFVEFNSDAPLSSPAPVLQFSPADEGTRRAKLWTILLLGQASDTVVCSEQADLVPSHLPCAFHFFSLRLFASVESCSPVTYYR